MSKFTSIPTVILNLIADIHGDDLQGKLPEGYAMRIVYAMLKSNSEDLHDIRAELKDAAFVCLLEGDPDAAKPWLNAYNYCVAGAQCLEHSI